MQDIQVRTLENVLKKPDKKVKTEREKQKRVITTENRWNFKEDELNYENQWALINQIYKKNIVNREHCELIIKQIHGKISGYRNQDVLKKKFAANSFIDEEYVIEAMIKCKNLCFYCKEPVNILYEIVRAPKQWSLDRINNDIGHDKGNVEIACLACNLRRKTMHHDRYVFTKQLDIKKID
jgi:hypothetical protein